MNAKKVMLQFRGGNRIPYGQDRAFLCGLPHGILFEARRLEGTKAIRLVAFGYGDLSGKGHGGAYGNGALYAYGRWVNSRFDAAVKGE